MTIGATIKKLRRERDITQEQLAEYLSVSPQAVSQWETDKTAPDISQLPALANVFGITTDRLLGVDITKNKEKIKAIIDEANAYYAKSQFAEAIPILEKGLREFPRSFELMSELSENLSCLGKCGEAIELCDKILAECTDDKIRYETIQRLIFAYNNSGNNKKAVELANTCPPAWMSRENCLMLTLEKGDKAAKDNLQDYALFCLGRLMICLRKLGNDDVSYSDGDRIKLLQQSADVGETLFCDGDSTYFSYMIAESYKGLSKIYARLGDSENTLRCLESACKHVVRFLTYSFDSVHTSPAFRGQEVVDWMPNPDGTNHADEMLKSLEESVYDFIRDSDRFSAVVAELGKYTRNA